MKNIFCKITFPTMTQAFGTYKDKIESILTKEFNNYISKFDFINEKNFNSVLYDKLNNKTLNLNFMFNLDTNVNSLLVNKFITNYINKENNIFKEILDCDISNSEVNVSKISASEKVIVKGIINKILEGVDIRKVLSETNFDSLEDNKITAILQFLDVTNTPENREKIELSGYNDNVYLVSDTGAVMVCNDSEADAEFKDAFMSIVDDLGLDYFSDSDQKYIIDNFIKNDIIDWDAVCKWVKKNDGRGVPLSWADGCEYKENVNGEIYYLYPRDEVDNLKDAFSEVD